MSRGQVTAIGYVNDTPVRVVAEYPGREGDRRVERLQAARRQRHQAQARAPAFGAGASAAAGAAAAPQQAQQQPGEQPRHFSTTPGGDGGRPREMRLDARGWGANQPKLDIGVPADAFQIWKDRAMMFLSRERPDVRKLLSWAETQTKETLQNGLAAQAAHLGIVDLVGVEYALHDGIKMTIMDSLLGRARNCIERGCELWRSLCAEWSGAAPQLQLAKAEHVWRRCDAGVPPAQALGQHTETHNVE